MTVDRSVAAGVVDPSGEAGPLPSDWAWSNVPDDADMPSIASYELLRDTISQAFNPPDDDAAEESIMTAALDRAWRFIVAQPCTCPPGAATFEVDACDRCQVLGRSADVAVER